MKTNSAVVLVSLATSAIVSAIPLSLPNYEPTLQIPQSVFDFQKPNILTRSESLWGAGSEFVIADSEPNPSAPESQRTPQNDPVESPTNGDSHEKPVPKKGSGLPLFSQPDDSDITHLQLPEFNPGNEPSNEIDRVLDLLLHKSF